MLFKKRGIAGLSFALFFLVCLSLGVFAQPQGFVSCVLAWEETEVPNMHYCNASREYSFCKSLDEPKNKCFTFDEVTTGESWVEFDLGDNRRQQMIFTKKTVFEQGGEIVPFQEEHSLSLKNGNFVMTWADESLALQTELLFSVNGTMYTIAGLKSLFEGIEVKTFEQDLSSGTKFWYEIQNAPEQLRESLEYIKLTVKPYYGFSAEEIESVEKEELNTFETMLPDGLQIDFSDLVNQEKFGLEFENNYTLIIRDNDQTDGKWGETISLDPVFQSSGPSEDVELYYKILASESSHRIYMKFDISSIPSGATINSAVLQVYVNDDSDDDDYTFYHFDQNQTWTENDSVQSLYAMHTGTSLAVTNCFAGTGDQNCTITSVFQAAYSAGDQNFSFRMEDPDSNSESPNTKSNTVFFLTGNGSTVYKDFDSSEGTNPPILFVDYNNTGAITAPSSLQVDANSSYALNSGNGATRLTWSDNSSNEDGFRVYRSQSDTNFSLLTTISAGSNSYSDLGTGDNLTLFYKVSAYNTSGDSNTSTDSNITFDRSPPAASSLSLSSASNYVDLNWSLVDDNSNSGLDSNLIAYWRLDETSGSFALDSADGDQNGTLNGNASFSNGKIGNATAFDGVDDFVDVNSAALNLTQYLTFGAWVKPGSLSASTVLFGKGNYNSGSPQTSYFIYYYQPTNVLYCWTAWSGNTSVSVSNGSSLIRPGEWHHVLCTFNTDNNALTLYVDGVQRVTGTKIGPSPNSHAFRIGGLQNGSGLYLDFNGSVDDVRIYNRALSATDVNALYLRGVRRYDAYRSTDNSSFSRIASVHDLNTYHDTGVTDQNAPQIPSTPTASALGTTSIDVNWSAVQDNNTSYYYKINAIDFFGNDSNSSTSSTQLAGTGVANYFVNCVSGGTCTSDANDSLDDYNGSLLGRRATGLSSGTQYCFKIKAIDGADNNSSESSQACATTDSTVTASVPVSGGGGLFCGDGTCGKKEFCSTCPSDCGVCQSVCGNGVCEDSESSSSCSQDCAVQQAFCGDGACNDAETSSTCGSDCRDPPSFSSQASRTCREQKGTTCTPGEYCSGEWANASNSSRCCTGACYLDPDLTVIGNADFKVTKSKKEGSVVITIYNKGGATKSGFNVALVDLKGTKQVILDKKTVSGLFKKDAVSVLFKVPFDEELKYSFSKLKVIVDPENKLIEADKKNNEFEADVYFAGEELCENGLDDDLDSLVDEDCSIAHIVVESVKAAPVLENKQLSSIEFTVDISAEFADAKNFYVNFYKDNAQDYSNPVAAMLVPFLAKGDKKSLHFTYDYSRSVAFSGLSDQMGRFFMQVEGENLVAEFAGSSTPNLKDITPPLPASRDISFLGVTIPSIVVLGRPVQINGAVKDTIIQNAQTTNTMPDESQTSSAPPTSTATEEEFSYDAPKATNASEATTTETGQDSATGNTESTPLGIEVTGSVDVSLYVDGKFKKKTSVPLGSLSGFSFDIGSASLGTGKHRIRLAIDEDGKILETNTQNNEYNFAISIIETGRILGAQRVLLNEPIFVSFWAEKQYSDYFYNFVLKEENQDAASEVLATKKEFKFNKFDQYNDFIIKKLSPTTIVPNEQKRYAITVERGTDASNAAEIGKTQSFQVVQNTPENISETTNLSARDFLSGDASIQRTMYEKLVSLRSLWSG